MRRSAIWITCFLLLLTQAGAQERRKAPKTFNDYCWENPKAPSCKQWGFTEHSKAIERSFENRSPKPPASNSSGVIVNRHLPPAGGVADRVRSRLATPPSMVVMSVPDWRFAHPEAGLLGAIKLPPLIESPMGPSLLGQIYLQLQATGMSPDQLAEFRNGWREIEQISISFRPGTASRPPDGLILVTGRLETLPRLFSGRALALPSGGLLLGAPAAAKLATGRTAGAPVAAWSPLFSMVRELEEQSDFWFAGNGSTIATPEIRKMLGSSANLLAGVRSFAFGLALRDGVKMDLLVNTTTPAAAERIVAAYRELEAKSKDDPAAGQTQIEKLPSGVRIRVTADKNQVSAGMSQLAAKLGIPWNPPPQAVKPSRPSPNAIVIDGLGSPAAPQQPNP